MFFAVLEHDIVCQRSCNSEIYSSLTEQRGWEKTSLRAKEPRIETRYYFGTKMLTFNNLSEEG